MTRARDLARIANSNALTIDSSGNVGIGFTVPTSKLSVVGIVSATSFSGSGANLTGVISGVGINTAGGSVGTGATILDFRGVGISTVTVSAGIATINITGGGSGGYRLGEDFVQATKAKAFVNLDGNIFYPDSYVGSYFTEPNFDIVKPYPFMPTSNLPPSSIKMG